MVRRNRERLAGARYAIPFAAERARLDRDERRFRRTFREGDMSVLLFAFGAIAAIWICVLLFSPMLGSDH